MLPWTCTASERVRRARGVVAAHLAVEGTDQEPVDLEQPDQDVLHAGPAGRHAEPGQAPRPGRAPSWREEQPPRRAALAPPAR